MATEFNAQVDNGKHCLRFETDNREYYLLMQETARQGGLHIWRCNRCGRGVNDNPEGVDLYCYHCGAKMDEVSE